MVCVNGCRPSTKALRANQPEGVCCASAQSMRRARQRPGAARVVHVRDVVVLEAAEGAVVVLLRRQPVAGAHGGLEAVGAAQPLEADVHAVHDLAGVEDHRPAARLAEVAGEGAVGLLDRQLPVDHPPRARLQVRLAEPLRRLEEGLDDVAGGLGVARQPAVLEAPARGHAAGVVPAVAHVLRALQPVDRAFEVRAVVAHRLPAPGRELLQHQPQVQRAPGAIADRQVERYSVHGTGIGACGGRCGFQVGWTRSGGSAARSGRPSARNSCTSCSTRRSQLLFSA